METGQNETTAVETVDYNQQALESFNGAVGKIDFGIMLTMTTAVITATIGIVVACIAINKGFSKVKRAIKGM